MGLSLNNIYQRPYVKQDNRNPVKRREEDEKSTAANTQKEQESNSNAKSKGLQYVEQKTPSYTPAYEQKFNIPNQNGYSNVNVNTSIPQHNVNTTAPVNAAVQNKIDSQINIAQILKDFRNTALAIGTPDELYEEVNDYIGLIEKQVKRNDPDTKLIKSNLKNAASILDRHISETLNKNSKVVENWVDTLFLQKSIITTMKKI